MRWPLPAGGFVKDVLDGLPAPPPPYTTLASTLRNLERKGYVRSEKLGNSYHFVQLAEGRRPHYAYFDEKGNSVQP